MCSELRSPSTSSSVFLGESEELQGMSQDIYPLSSALSITSPSKR